MRFWIDLKGNMLLLYTSVKRRQTMFYFSPNCGGVEKALTHFLSEIQRLDMAFLFLYS